MATRSTEPPPSASALAQSLEPHGLNLLGVAPVAAYDAGAPPAHRLGDLLAGATSVVVVGHGGGAFWERYRAHCRAHPEHETRADPVDDYAQHVIGTTVPPLFGSRPFRVLYPFLAAPSPVSFVRLAVLAGLGRPSLVGVLVHPEYGPWMALRAAVLLTLPLAAARPADGFDPCPTCVERACIPACPGGAVGASGWDVARCAAHRALPDEDCAGRCHARFDCVLGREHRYPADALAYHQGRARGPLLATDARR